MIYIAVDPGQTTGILVALRRQDEKDHIILGSYEILWHTRFASINTLIKQYAPQRPIIICETFLLFSNAPKLGSNNMPSSQFIGSLQQSMYENGLDPEEVVFVHPRNKTNECMLKSDLLALKPSSAHCLDAYKLFIHYRMDKEGFSPDSSLCFNQALKSVTRIVQRDLICQ